MSTSRSRPCMFPTNRRTACELSRLPRPQLGNILKFKRKTSPAEDIGINDVGTANEAEGLILYTW